MHRQRLLSLETLARTTPAGLAVLDSMGEWRPAPHLSLLNERLLGVAAGRIRRLLVLMPPRHGKSTLVSRYFPAWYVGRWPHRHVLLASYEADVAKRWGRRARDTLQAHGDAFGVRVRDDVSGAKEWETDQGGGMFAAGVGGPFTGRGGSILIIDDPVKNQVEARSRLLQDRNYEWYRSTALTRLEAGGSIVLVMTRWSHRDLAGAVLEQEKDAWSVVNLRAIAGEGDELGRTPGEALWPERFPLSELEQVRDAQGPTWFAAMYQGHPSPDEGAIFKRAWFRYWSGEGDEYVLHDAGGDRRVSKADCQVFTTADTAATESEQSDYTVFSTWALTPQADMVWLDLVRVRMETTSHESLARGVYAKWGGWIGVEQATYGLRLVQALKNTGLPIRGLKADRDKVARARVAEAVYSVGKAYHPSGAEWLGVAEAELLDFPNGAHDDVVDTVGYAAIVRATVGRITEGPGLDLTKYY